MTIYPEAISSSSIERAQPTKVVQPQSLWQRILGSASSLAGTVVHGLSDRFFSHYQQKLDKKRCMEKARSEMLAAAGDPQFVTAADILCPILGERVGKKLDGMAEGGAIQEEIFRQKSLIRDLVEINLMQGLANIAKEVELHKDRVPNSHSQTALVNLIAFLTQKFRLPLAVEKIQAVAPESELQHREFLNRVFADRKEPEVQKAIQTVVNACREDDGYYAAIQLFESRLTTQADFQEFLVFCEKEAARQQQMDEIFMPMVEELLKLLFHERLDGIVLPYFSSVLGMSFVRSAFLETIRDTLSELFRESFDSMQNALARRPDWEDKISERAPHADLSLLIHTPAELLVKGLQNYIRTSPHAALLLEEGLESLMPPAETGFEDLAGWILQSLQMLFHTKDPHLLEAGQYASLLVGNLALALVAKGIDISMAGQGPIAPDQYLHVLIEQFIHRVNRIRHGEMISDEVWKEIVDELPLPEGIKPFLLQQIIAKAKSAQKALEKRGIYTERIEAYYAEAEEEIRPLRGAGQLIAICVGITNLILKEIVSETIQATQLGEKYVELLDEYLPGLILSEEVKTFLRNNIHALTFNGGDEEAPEALELLRKGIQAAILKSMARAVRLNIEDPNGNYAAQISEQVRSAFTHAFQHFTEEEKEDLFTAMELQKEALILKKEIEKLQKQIHAIPEGLPGEQLQTLEQLFLAKKRVIRNAHHIQTLNYKEQDLLKRAETSSSDSDKRKWQKAAVSIGQTILQAKGEQVYYLEDLRDQLSVAERAGLPKEGLEWMEQTLRDLDAVHYLTQEKETVEAEISERLTPFKDLSTQIMAMLGLDQKEHLQVPDFLKDHIWPLVEEAKEKVIVKLLFEQLSPLLPSVFNREIHREIIRNASGSDFWASAAKAASEEIVSKLSRFITNADTEEIAREISQHIPGGEGLHALIEPELRKILNSDDSIFVENRKFLQQYIEGIFLLYTVKLIRANENQDILKLIKTNIKGSNAEEIVNAILTDILHIRSEDDLLNIPPALKKHVYKEIKTQAHSLLTPILTSILERKANLARLDEQSGSRMFGHLSRTMANDLIHLLPKAVSPKMENAELGDCVKKLLESHPVAVLGAPYLEGVLMQLFLNIAKKCPPTRGKDSFHVLLETLVRKAAESPETLLEDVLGIASPADIPGLPPPAQAIVFNYLKKRFFQALKNLYASGGRNPEAEEALKKFGVDARTGRPLAQILAEDAAHAAIETVPFILDDPKGDTTYGLELIADKVERKLEAYSAEGLETANALLHYQNLQSVGQTIGELIHEVAKEDQFPEEKARAKTFLSNFFLAPLNALFSQVSEFESQNGKEWTRKMAAKLLVAAREHVQASKEPKSPQERSECFKLASREILPLFFPRGAEDLTFVPKELRALVWEIIEDTLFPSLLETALETLLSPVNLSKITLQILKTTRDTLSGPIVDAPAEIDDELTTALGEFVLPLIQQLELPGPIKNRLLTPEGALQDSIKTQLGLSLARQLTDTFIRDNLALALKNTVAPDPVTGAHLIQPVKIHSRDRAAVDRAEMARLGRELKTVSREVVDAGIGNLIRNYYFQFKKSFDQKVQSAFGKTGLRIKHALDAAFDLIFCKIIGTILSYVLWPLSALAKRGVYSAISLDANRDAFVHFLTEEPRQVHEDLLFHLLHTLLPSSDRE